MYAQAVELIRRGERFTLNDEEIRQLNEHNRDYQAPDPAMELIVTYFRKPRTEAETLYMTATKIAAKFAPLVKISSVRIGMALGEFGYAAALSFIVAVTLILLAILQFKAMQQGDSVE